MKFVACIFAFFCFTIDTTACPQFAAKDQRATFEWQTKTGNFALQVTQITKDSVVTYTFEDGIDAYTFRADGIEHFFEDKPRRTFGRYLYSCEDNSLIASSEISTKNSNNELIEILVSNQFFTRDQNTGDMAVSSRTVRAQGPIIEDTSEEYNCLLKSGI